MSTGCREPRTFQERRENIAVRYDHELHEAAGKVMIVRPKRVNLPTDWSDLPHSESFRTNSWKRHRKTQYRPTVVINNTRPV